MIEVADCPCCGSSAWEQVASTTYRAADEGPSPSPGRAWANRMQRDFVFSEWLPGQTEVTLRELVCGDCGVLVFSPRPSQRDVDRKYELLVEHGVPLGAASLDTAGERSRAEQIRRRLAPQLPRAAPRILDIGGGDGRLMSALLADGAACFLVDYSNSQVEGVAKLGDTLDDLSATEHFEAIILSHVLEHVAEPGELLSRARAIASSMYVEIPVEIWRGTPVATDPVTHVNYFTEASLRAALEHSGWGVVRSRTEISTYAGSRLEVAWAVAAGGASAGQDQQPAAETRRRLNPGVVARATRRVRWSSFAARGRWNSIAGRR